MNFRFIFILNINFLKKGIFDKYKTKHEIKIDIQIQENSFVK